MQNDIMFDNIYIGHSVEDARKFAEETFFEKHPIEQLLENADKPKEEEKPKSPSDLKFLDDPVLYVKEKLDLFLTLVAKDPIEAVKFVPEVPGAIAAILAVIISGVVLMSGSAAPAAKKVAADAKDKAKDVKDKAAEAIATGADTVKDGISKRTTRSQS